MSQFVLMKSAAFSAIMTVAAAVPPDTMVGMIEASTTLSPSTPCTLEQPGMMCEVSGGCLVGLAQH